MAKPSRDDWQLLKRVVRYILGTPRAVQMFIWQSPQSELDTFVDSDWAGCRSSYRSTSGGVTRLGWHTIKSWSTTQATVAMSSAEAELFSLVKGAANTLGFISLANDLGLVLQGTVHCDASATLSIVRRQGLGKLRHVNVRYMWVQDRVRTGDFKVAKVDGKWNPADLFTKYLPAANIEQHMESLGFETSTTRADIAPRLTGSARSFLQQLHEERSDEDGWLHDGDKVSRKHSRPRSCLFTPIRVAGAPPARALTAMRVTEGKFLGSGLEFIHRDNWTSRASAHQKLREPWIGKTTFWIKS